MADQFLTVQDVKQRLNVSIDWIYKEVRAGRIPHRRIGRLVRFDQKELEDWISAQAVGLRCRTQD